ncbi:MAG: NUDIX domain-containing protein, partial [Candidatus Caldatribacteriota bacterium]
MSKIIDAVSIILTCGDEIFLIERQHYLKAFPGYISFPGGKVEKDDAFFSIEQSFGQDPLFLGAAIR